MRSVPNRRRAGAFLALLLLPGCLFITEPERLARTDADGDGIAAIEDCDDADAAIGAPVSEQCNGIDDDCDGALDEGLHPDADGDGFGTADGADGPCFVGWVETVGDCDDGDRHTYPGAPEQCDGRGNDCAPEWAPADDAGLVTWRSSDGTETEDWTAAFAGNTVGAAEPIALPADGTLFVCGAEEPYAVRLVGEDVLDLEIRGVPLGETGPIAAAPTLHGLDSEADGATLRVEGEDWRLSLRALRLVGGVATEEKPGGGLRLVGGAEATLRDLEVTTNVAGSGTEGGAGLFVEDVGRLAILDSRFVANTGESGTRGGGILARDVDLRLDAVRFEDNLARGYGGGLAMESGQLTVFDSAFIDNEGSDGGGALFIAEGVDGFLQETDFATNVADQGGGAWIEGNLSCFDVRDSTTFVDHEARYRGAVWAVIDTGRASFDGCTTSGGFVSTFLEPAAHEGPDVFVGESGQSGGSHWTITGNWLFCDLTSECYGDVVEGE